jgi:chemotaxis protein MotB
MMNNKPRPIIVIKKKGGHGGHHGGAWKVAYADFVTAMMALFIVLWLLSSSEKVKKAVAGYFNDPKGTGSQLGTVVSGTGEGEAPIPIDEKIKRLKEKLEKEIQASKALQKLAKQIEITITSEGLRIELIEDKNGTFYKSGSAQLSQSGQELLLLLATELKTIPNTLLIEGHTDSMQYSKDKSYGNWELSADRANSARRLLQTDGVRSNQVSQVRGYADQMPRTGKKSDDPANRRITLLVSNTVQNTLPTDLKGGVVSTPTAEPEATKPTQGAKEGAATKPVAKPK